MKPLHPAVSKSLRLTAAASLVLAACERNPTQNSPPPNEPSPNDKVTDAPAPDNTRRNSPNDLPGGSDGSTPTPRDPARDGTSGGGGSNDPNRPSGGGR